MKDKFFTEKLVRDNIPDIIRADGKEPEIRKVSGDELKMFLGNKVVEELYEFESEPSVEEMADLYDAVYFLAKTYGITLEEILVARLEKLIDRGAFEEGYVLKIKE